MPEHDLAGPGRVAEGLDVAVPAPGVVVDVVQGLVVDHFRRELVGGADPVGELPLEADAVVLPVAEGDEVEDLAVVPTLDRRRIGVGVGPLTGDVVGQVFDRRWPAHPTNTRSRLS